MDLWQIRDPLRPSTETSHLAESLIPRFQEKLLSFSLRRPYRKPTQVGRMRILRRLRELG